MQYNTNLLLEKLHKAVTQTGVPTIVVAGGVVTNSHLRAQLRQFSMRDGWEVFIPKAVYCTDNAAMIATAAYYQYLQGDFVSLKVSAKPRFPL